MHRGRHLDLGDKYFHEEHYQEALQEYRLAEEESVVGFEMKEARYRVALCLEALGNFPDAIKEIGGYLIPDKPPNTDFLSENRLWKQALEAASQGHYDVAVKYYRDRLANARDREKKALFLDQRLRLMEERARSAGQLQPEGS